MLAFAVSPDRRYRMSVVPPSDLVAAGMPGEPVCCNDSWYELPGPESILHNHRNWIFTPSLPTVKHFPLGSWTTRREGCSRDAITFPLAQAPIVSAHPTVSERQVGAAFLFEKVRHRVAGQLVPGLALDRL